METLKQMTPEEVDKAMGRQKPEEDENCCCAPILIAAVLAIALAITGYFLYLSYDDNEAIKKELEQVRELYYERPTSTIILDPSMVDKCFSEADGVMDFLENLSQTLSMKTCCVNAAIQKKKLSLR